MLIGYARVSTADRNPEHQIDALERAGVARENIHIDTASEAKASRSKLTADQAILAQRLYDERKETVQQIADMFGVPRSMVYGHLDREKTVPCQLKKPVVTKP